MTMLLSKLISRFRKPLAVRQVRGDSMSPTLSDGQIVVFSSVKRVKDKHIVLSDHEGKNYVKRLHVSEDRHSLRGDNLFDSYDLEDIRVDSIYGSLIYPHR